MISRFAVAGAAGLALGVFAAPQAVALDLGGSCCADVQGRIAELDTAKLRQGDGKISLMIWGEVNRALLMWGDGIHPDVAVMENSGPAAGAQIRFSGSGEARPGVNAGFVLELGVSDTPPPPASQPNSEAPGEAQWETRLANWYVESEQAGRITIGQARSATYGITTIDVSHARTDALPWISTSILLRHASGRGLEADFMQGEDGSRSGYVRYDTPSIYGFIVSAAWGEDSSWDVALRFKQEWEAIRLAAGLGYVWANEDNGIGGAGKARDFVSGSVSAMHVPSGIFVNFAAGRANPGAGAGLEHDGYMYFVQLGLEQRFLSYGATTVYAEYGRYGNTGSGWLAGIGGRGSSEEILSASAVDRLGFGVVQQFNASAVEVFGAFQYFGADMAGADVVVPASGSAGGPETWYGVVVGSRIKF